MKWTRRAALHALRVGLTVVSLLVTAVPSSQATGASLDRAIAVVLDPQSLARVGSIDTGEVVTAYVVLLDHDLAASDGVRALHFAIDVDPRLLVVDTRFEPDVIAPIQVGEREWAVGLSTCADVFHVPTILMQLDLVQLAENADATDLYVHVIDPPSLGGPPRFSHCYWNEWNDALVSFGGILLDPSGPRVLGLAAERPVVVEGRSYELGWETAGADSVFVDGALVSPGGVVDRTATAPITHEVRAVLTSGLEHRASFAVDVIRAPRVVSFAATQTDVFGDADIRLEWNVEGCDFVEIVGEGTFPGSSSLLVRPNGTDVWEMRATNEWGTTIATATPVDLATSPPLVSRFDATPTWFLAGEEVELRYLVVNAEELRIEPEVGPVDVGDGMVVVRPSTETVYSLIATNANGTTTRELVLRPGPPRIVSFSMLPISVDRGDTVHVTWYVEGADTVEITPEIGTVDPQSGALDLSAFESTWYTMSATNAWGTTIERRVIEVIRPTIVNFSAQPAKIFPGQSSVLSWNTFGQARIFVGPPEQERFGSHGTWTVTPEADSTVYWLRMEGLADTVRAERTVVWSKPDVRVTLPSSTQIYADSPFSMTIQASGADSLFLEPGFGAIDPTGGTFTTSVADTTEFVVRGINRAGVEEQRFWIRPRFRAPTATLQALDSVVYGGGQVRLRASIAYADSAILLPEPGPIPPTGGTFGVTVDDTTTFTLKVGGRGGSLRKTLEIRPIRPFVRLDYDGHRARIGETVQLRVTVTGAQRATLEPGVGDVETGATYEVVIDSATTFVLEAWNTLGSSTSTQRVELVLPEILGFDAATDRVLPGEEVELRWSSIDAEGTRLIGSDGTDLSGLPATGSIVVSPLVETLYELVALNPQGSTEDSTVVDVGSFVIRDFAASRDVVWPGTEIALSWTVDGEAEVWLDDLGPLPTEGSQTVTVREERRFVLRATGNDDVHERSVDVGLVNANLQEVRYSWSDQWLPGSPVALHVDEPFVLYMWMHTAQNGAARMQFRPVMPEGMELLEATPVAAGVTRQLLPDPLDLRFTLQNCELATTFVPAVRLKFVPRQAGFGGQRMDFGPVSFAGPQVRSVQFVDCNGAEGTFFRREAILLHEDRVAAMLALLRVARTQDGVRVQWSTTQPTCARAVEIWRGTGDQADELVRRLDSATGCADTEWTDAAAPADRDLVYRAIVLTDEGTLVSEAARLQATALPARSRLLGAVPNPFNPRTEIRFELSRPSPARIEIHDSAGRRVRTLDLGPRPAGAGQVVWTGDDDRGRPVASGAYLLRLVSESGSDVRRVVLLR